MSTPQYGDYQFDIYFYGLEGQLPKHPVDFAIYCSNHGGRQANGGLPALDALPAVVEAAGGMPVLFDSGVRSGSDVARALAPGATAVGIGRPNAYALAVGGTDGVVAQLRAILAELDLLMAIDGFPPSQTCALRAPNAFSSRRPRRSPSSERKTSCRSFM